MTSRTRRITLVSLAVLVLCGLGAIGVLWAHFWPLSEGKSTAFAIGGPFTLTGSDGKPVTDKSFRGKWLLIYFGYTYCPDVCPTTLNEIAQALDEIGPLANQVAPLFITVDPERDTPEVVGKYVKAFGPRIIGLTGTPEEIAAAAKEYRVYFKKAPTGTGGNDYLMDHSSIIYLMNPEGQYVTLFAGDQKPDKIASRLRRVIGHSS
ncbi:MAG TPA: SCO family protein [Alphaproteobacteria bacterium]|nr:SCO family protein [Alphaproteobacteria bacterium]